MITNRWSARSEDFSDGLRASSGLSDEEIIERIAGDETLGDAFASAGGKARLTSDAPLRATLARLVGAALRDDAKVDDVAYLTSVVVQMEPVHLRYLWTLREVVRVNGNGNYHVTDIAQLLKVSPDIAQSVAERLHSLALLTDRREGDMLNWTGNPHGAFALTPIASTLLEYCDEVPTTGAGGGG